MFSSKYCESFKKPIYFEDYLRTAASESRAEFVPNEKLFYILSSLNHPPQSSNIYQITSLKDCRKIFNIPKDEYEDALKKSGYNVDLEYTNNKSEKQKRDSEK